MIFIWLRGRVIFSKLITDNKASFENNGGDKQTFDAGLDAKIAINSSLNLDLTVNPDFAQAEVDEQITNLDRFELFFPEKRQFEMYLYLIVSAFNKII